MTQEIILSPRAFCVRFCEIKRWDPISYHDINWQWPKESMLPIGELLIPRKEKVDRAKNNFTDLMPVTIHFDGSIEPRNMDSSKEYSMDLFWARPNDLVISKIDLKNGAVAIVPESWKNVVVTGHFAVYKPNEDLIIPEYFTRIIQAGFFKNYLWRNKVGAEGRKEVKLEFFESITIPIPSLLIQNRIVERWQRARKEIAAIESKLSRIKKELDLTLQQSTNAFFSIKSSRFFVVGFSQASQWDAKSGRSSVFRTLNPEFVRLGDFSEECTELVKPWKEPVKDWPVYGVDNERGVFFNSYQKGKDFKVAYKRIKENWFFHNPTRANVGSLGMVPNVPSDSITSPEYQVWRLKDGFLPEFMALLLKTNYFLTLVEFNRVGGVKQRMYYANLAEIRLPMLDLDVQIQFANEWMIAQMELQKAEMNLKETQKEIEEMILGIRHVE